MKRNRFQKMALGCVGLAMMMAGHVWGQAAFTAADTFDTAIRDASKWGPADELQPEGSAEWVQAGGKLEFRSEVNFLGNAYGFRTWSGASPSYAQDWSVSVDVNLAAITVDFEEGATLALRVANGSDDADALSISMLAYRSFEGEFFRQVALQGDVDANRALNLFETTSAQTLKFTIRYDANSRVLVAEYGTPGGTPRVMGTLDTGMWGMQSDTPFNIALQAQAFGFTFGAPAGQLRFDNFQIQGSAARNLVLLQGGDDFNDNSRNTTLWGALNALAGSGALTETAGALQFSTSAEGSSGFADMASQFWRTGAASLSNSWTARVEATLGAIAFANPNEEVQLGLTAVSLDDPTDRVLLALGLGNTDSGTVRNWVGSLRRDGASNPDYDIITPTASTSVALQIRWDVNTRKFYLEVDNNGATGGFTWTTLTNYSVESEDLSWELTSASRIQIGLFGVGFDGVVVPNSGIAKFDNLVLTTDLPVVEDVKVTQILKVGSQIQLQWTGGKGPFQVQRRDRIDQTTWTNVGGSTAAREALVPLSGTQGFFRIQDLGQ